MDPAAIQFTAVQGNRRSCRGCIFEQERSTVCHQASVEAVRRQLPDCEHPDEAGRSIIYVAVEVDPRQRDLFNE